ncbi:MAG: hypothetical protein JWQ45_1506, partial [Blastococcus sp.]|nr:hypothetical protein [Blastococcus sp.]
MSTDETGARPHDAGALGRDDEPAGSTGDDATETASDEGSILDTDD